MSHKCQSNHADRCHTDRHDGYVCPPEPDLFRHVTLWLYALLALMMLLFARAASAKGTDFDVKRMPLSDAISLLWGEVLHTPFMLAPELAADSRLVTLHIFPADDERQFITRYLDNMHIVNAKIIDRFSPFLMSAYSH